MSGMPPPEEPEQEPVLSVAHDIEAAGVEQPPAADSPASEFPEPPGRRGQLLFLATIIVVLVVVFLGIWPVRELLFPPQVKMPSHPGRPPRVVWQPDPRTSIRIGLTEGIMCLWVFTFGASMGSFLHVVLYRVPLGKSIVSGGSKCPRCGHAIRATDNLPVIGWLRLGGKCRDCGWPIPFRYPLAELVFGGMYLGLTLLELHLGSPNLPGFSGGPVRLADNIWPHDPFPLIQFVYHLALAHWLLLGLLFAADGNRLPRGIFWFAIAAGAIAPLLWPGLHSVDWQGTVWQPPTKRELLTAATTSLAGLIIGALVAWRWVAGRPSVASRATGAALWLVSVYLGWQMGLMAGAVAVAIDGLLLLSVNRQRDFPRLSLITAAIGVLFLSWRWLINLPGFPAAPFALAGGVLLAVCLLPRLKAPESPVLIEPQVRG